MDRYGTEVDDMYLVGSGQAEPSVGVGFQALQIPTGEYDEYSGQLGGLLDGGIRNAKIYYWCGHFNIDMWCMGHMQRMQLLMEKQKKKLMMKQLL